MRAEMRIATIKRGVWIASAMAVLCGISGCSLFWPPADRTILSIDEPPEYLKLYTPLADRQRVRTARTSFPAGPFGKRIFEDWWINDDGELIVECGDLFLEVVGWNLDTWSGVQERWEALPGHTQPDHRTLVVFSVRPALGAVCVLFSPSSELRHRYPEHGIFALHASRDGGTYRYPDYLYTSRGVLFMRRARGVAAVLDVIDMDSGQGLLDNAVVGDGSVLFSHGDLGYTLTLDDGVLLVDVVEDVGVDRAARIEHEVGD